MIKEAECAELRRKEAIAITDKFTPMFEKLTDAIHKIENKLGIHNVELKAISDNLSIHVANEEAQQEKIAETLSNIHKRVTNNSISGVSKAEMRWIVGLLVTGFVATAGYMINQLDHHSEDMDKLNDKIYYIETND